MGDTLIPGSEHEVRVIVLPEMTAPAYVTGTPEAFATPALVGMIERAAAELVQAALGEGETTVGTSITLRHLAATPAGMTVRCLVRLSEVDRRRLVFTAEAWDECEKIGEATHERFIVYRESFMRKLRVKAETRPL